MRRQKKSSLSTRSIAKIAIFSALSILFLTLVRLSPVADLLFYLGSSFCVALVLIDEGRQAARYTYLVTSLISLVLPGWLFAWPFYLFFGLYPILKSLLECYARDRNGRPRIWNFVVKTLLALLLGGGAIAILQWLVPGWFDLVAERLPFSLPFAGQVAIVIGMIVMIFYLYDHALSLLIDRYQCKSRH